MTKDKAKIALVTGASQGLVKKGVGVIVTDRSSEAKVNSVVSAIAYGGDTVGESVTNAGTKVLQLKAATTD